MADTRIKINRTPVMTLWAAVVAERLGFDQDESLTMGKVVTGLNAQAKGQRLGIFKPPEKEAPQKMRQRTPGETFYVELLGRSIPAVNTSKGLRATEKGDPVDPAAVRRYLEKKFGSALPEVRPCRSWQAPILLRISTSAPTPCTKNSVPQYPKVCVAGARPASSTWT